MHLRLLDRIIRKAIEIELHPNNINREDGFSLSRLWKPLILDQKQALDKNMTPSGETCKRAVSSLTPLPT
jgi:hypothetical protein